MKLIYILLLLTLLSGCKVKKRIAAETERLTQQTEQKDVKQTEQIQTEVTAHRKTEAETVTEGTTTVYDTEKPPDPTTGKPPVKSETNWKQTKKEKAGEETVQVTQKNAQRQDKSRIDTQLKEQTKVDERVEKDVFRIPWIWIITGGAAMIAAGYYVRYKKII